MEAPGEGDDRGTAGGGAGHLHGVLDRFGAGGEEDGLGRSVERGQRIQSLGQFHIGLIGDHLEGSVGVGVELRPHGFQHPGMAVAGVEHGDAAGKIDIAAALDVPQLGVFGAGGEDLGGGGDSARHGGQATGVQVSIGGHGHQLR